MIKKDVLRSLFVEGVNMDVYALVGGLLSAGVCAPRVDQWMESVKKDPGSFYSSISAVHGTDIALSELVDLVEKRRYREFAAPITSIVSGVAMLASAIHLHVVQDFRSLPFSLRGMEGVPGKKFVVVWNSLQGFSPKKKLRGSKEWSRSGTFGLIAIVVGFAIVEGKYGEDATLGLVFERPLLSPSNALRTPVDGYTVVSITPDGIASVETTTYSIARGSMFQCEFGARSLGAVLGREKWASFAYDGMFAEHFGFPGAEDYLLKHLPSLGGYLLDVAGLHAGSSETRNA